MKIVLFFLNITFQIKIFIFLSDHPNYLDNRNPPDPATSPAPDRSSDQASVPGVGTNVTATEGKVSWDYTSVGFFIGNN